MNRLLGMTKSLLFFLPFVITTLGCATTWDYPLPDASQRKKTEVIKIWGHPTKVSTDPKDLKYGADEVWIYKNPEPGYPSLAEERLYFQDGILIKREGITLDAP